MNTRRMAAALLLLWIGRGSETVRGEEMLPDEMVVHGQTADAPADNEARRGKPRFTVVPPGPVTDKIAVELRLSVPNETERARKARVRFFWDAPDTSHLLEEMTITIPPGQKGYANAWWSAEGRAGRHRLLYRVEGEGFYEEGRWPIEVIASATPALPRLQGIWIESFAALRHAEGEDRAATERNIRTHIDSMKRLGINVLIIAYVEYQGTFFYPSAIDFFDNDVQRMARGSECPMDLVGIILSQADRNGMHVFLGIGRGGDTYLLWQVEKEGWAARNAAALDLGKRIARELWERYGSHPSFYGWYLTHEMNDLARASAYYDPMADFCHSLSPDMPVLVAPAGTPLLDRKTLTESRVDIFAYQDAVGSGYVPYKNTFNPENRIAMLEEIYTKYRSWHAGTRKHLWSDLEIWEMDGSQGYAGSYPPAFSRVKRQIGIEAKYVQMLTGYAWFGFMRPPESRGGKVDARAVHLYEEYAAYLKSHPK